MSMSNGPISPSVAAADAGVKEIDEVSKEFNQSLSIPNNSQVAAPDDDILPSCDVKEDNNNASAGATNNESPASDVLTTTYDEPETNPTKHFIAPKDFELRKVIGMGAFGKVLQVRNRHSAKIFAMKVISKRLIERKGAYVENILAERNILSKIANHPFIVTMHASFQTREKLFIIMDFCAGGELFLKLGREGHFREKTAAFYLAEITLALEHLHSINVLHRDLKPENILLGSDGHCCLTDFGLAKDFTGSGENDEDGRARTLCGTLEYMAPEMVARKWYGKGADFWSLGCIAYEMFSGDPPFSSKKGSKELFKKIMNERIRMPDGASAGACKLLKGLLNRDAGKRLGAARGTMFEMGGVGALKQQPFFSGLDWGKLELKEIDPPEEFGVDNDEDLRHFHDEFVNMMLPRSVREMSKLDFLPKHCESDNFRGFSFIGDSFPLPERSASENEHYWNNVEDDGQSLSECASSVFDDDFGETPAPEPTPEKKKRPPRKKKKKQQHIPLETTDEGNETKEKKAAKVKEASDLKPSDEGEPDVAPDTQKQVSQPAEAEQSNGFAISLNPNARVWGTPLRAAPQASSPKPMPAPQSTRVPPKPAATPSYAPTPGTWASLAVGKTEASKGQQAAVQSMPKAATSSTATINNRPIKSATMLKPSSDWTTINNQPTKPTTMPGPMASPTPTTKSQVGASPLSSDWRSHVVSPQRKSPHGKGLFLQGKAMGNMNISGTPPPPVAQPTGNVWPGLGDFPPPPRAGGKPKEVVKKAKPMGAWGK